MTRTAFLLTALALFIPTAAHSAPAVKTRSYFLKGVRNSDDVEIITAAIRRLPTVTQVTHLTPSSGVVSVRFDTHTISHGQVGYAIMDAIPGRTIDVRMRFSVPQYASGDNAAKIDALMKSQAKLADTRVADRAKGIWEARLLPFKVDPAATGPQGFHCGVIMHGIHDPVPKGMGLDFDFLGPNDKPDPLDY